MRKAAQPAVLCEASASACDESTASEKGELPIVHAKPIAKVPSGTRKSAQGESSSQSTQHHSTATSFIAHVGTGVSHAAHEVTHAAHDVSHALRKRSFNICDAVSHGAEELAASMCHSASSSISSHLSSNRPSAGRDFDTMIEAMWADQAKSFQRASASIKRQLRLHERGIINPRTSRWMPYWDFTSFVCLFFTAVFTPIEVCFVAEAGPVWFAVNSLVRQVVEVNVFFIIDLCLNFCMAYPRMWFPIDLLTIIDFQIIARAVLANQPGGAAFCFYCPSSDEESGDDSTSALRLVRTVRLLRLVKLLRILRASRIVSRWQDFFGFTYASLTLFKLLTSLCMLLHWYSCLWAYVALNWQQSSGDLYDDTTWIEYHGMELWVERDEMGKLYLVSLYVAVVSMFGGIGTIGPHNVLEYATLTGILFSGCFFWAYVISSLCSMLATLNPHMTAAAPAFRNTMDELNHFMDDNHFDTEHRVRIRRFFRSTQDFTRQSTYKQLLAKMSGRLRGDTALLIGVHTLRRVWYFNLQHYDMEKDFLAHIALAMQRHIYESKERFALHDLTVIANGTVCIGLRIVVKGCVLGEDCLINPAHEGLRSNATTWAACLTFVETASLSREAIFHTAAHFPRAKKHLEWVVRRLTLRGAVRKVIKNVHEEQMVLRNATYNRAEWQERLRAHAEMHRPERERRASLSFGEPACRNGRLRGQLWLRPARPLASSGFGRLPTR